MVLLEIDRAFLDLRTVTMTRRSQHGSDSTDNTTACKAHKQQHNRPMSQTEYLLRTACMVGTILAALFVMAADPKPEKPKGVLSPLEKGQTVTLKEVGGRYEIGLVPGVELGHKIIEVGADFVVVEDVAGAVQTRIPLCSVRAVTVAWASKK